MSSLQTTQGQPFLISAFCLALTAIAGCSDAPAGDNVQAATPAPLAVITAPANVMTIEATYQTTANLQADAEARVLARVRGQVITLAVEEGDRVMAGQTLATLDGDRLRLDMRRAGTELDKAANELNRMTELKERNLVSAAAYDNMGFGVDELKAAYELTRLDYDYSVIRAPIAGIVSARNVNPGSQLAVGESAFLITDTSRLIAELSIPQIELHKFKVGSPVTVITDAAPSEQFDATIARLSPTIDTVTGTFRATLYIDNSNDQLAPGMLGRFSIAYDQHIDALVVPTDAVVREDNVTVVYVIEQGTAVRKTVRTGIEADGQTEIIDGLSADDHVVLSGQSRLRDGSRVLARSKDRAAAVTG